MELITGDTLARDNLQYPNDKIAEVMEKIYPPIILVIGLFGNVLFVSVLLRPAIRKTSFAGLLVCLALADTVVLLFCVLKRWICFLLERNIREHSIVICKVDTFFTYFLLQFSPWILVLVTIERTYSVLYPHKVKDTFTKRRTLAAVTVIVIVLVVCNVHILVGIGVPDKDPMCVFHGHHEEFFFRIWSWIDTCLMFIIPASFLLIGNTIIIIKLKTSHHFRALSVRFSPNDYRRDCSRNHVASFTITTLILNINFIVLLLPSVIFSIGQVYWYPREALGNDKTMAELRLLSTIVYMTMYTYNAFNFVVYMLFGSKFRNEICKMLKGKRDSYSVKKGLRCRNTNSRHSTSIFQVIDSSSHTNSFSRS